MLKKALIIIPMLFWSIISIASSAVIPDYPADKIAPSVYVIHGPTSVPNPINKGFMNNPGIVMTSKGVVIIDPGATIESAEMVLRVLKTLTKDPVVAVFNTHQHADHWFGNAAILSAYPNIPIYADMKTIEAAPEVAEGWIDSMKELTQLSDLKNEKVLANKVVKNGHVVMVGDTRFTIYHVDSSHTHSDIMIAVNNDVVFMGDNLFNGRLNPHSGGHIKKTWEAVEHVAAVVKPKVFVPGHGKSGGLNMLQHSLNAHKLMYQSVSKQYENDVEDFEMRVDVEKAIADYKSWEEFDKQLGKVINKAYLEIEADSF